MGQTQNQPSGQDVNSAPETQVNRASRISLAFETAAAGVVGIGSGLVKMDINEMSYGAGQLSESLQWAGVAFSR